MTIAHDNRVKVLPNADGTEDTRYPNGDKPVSGTALTVDAVAYAALIGSAQGLPINVARTFNVRSVLSGTDAATAVLSLLTISGVDAASLGWSVSGDLLQYAGSVASPGGVLEVVATPAHGSAVVYPQIVWSSADPSGDTMAPTTPTGVTLVSQPGAVQISCDTAGDGYDGATAGGGVDHYNVYRGSVTPANKVSPPSPVPSPSTAVMPRLTVSTIGATIAPAPTVVQTKQSWAVSVAGTGFHGVAADQCIFFGAQMSGDQSMTVSVPAFNSVNAFSPAGPMVRESRAANSVFIAFYMQPGAVGLQAKSRDAAGAISANFLSVAGITGPCRLRVIRAGSLWTLLYSQDGGQWRVAGTKTLAMAQVCEWGCAAASQTAGAAFACTFVDPNLTASGQVSATMATAVAVSLGITAVDKLGNESPASVFALGTPLVTVPTGGKIVSNFGPYIYLDHNQSVDLQIASMSAFAGTAVKGFQFIGFWAQFENPNVPGDYSGNWAPAGAAGFQLMDKLLAACAAIRSHDGTQMRLMFHDSTYGFAGTNKPATFPADFMPAYLAGPAYGPTGNTEATGEIGGAWVNTKTMSGPPNNATVRAFCNWWRPAVMARKIAVMQGYGAAYDNPNPALNRPNANLLEMMSWIGESVIPLYTGYTDANAVATLVGPGNYFQVGRAAFPHKQLRYWGSYLQDVAFCRQITDAYNASFWACGGPDCANEGPPFQTGGQTGKNPRPFPMNRTFRGINPSTLLVDPTYRNYVGDGVWVSEFEPDEMGPRNGGAGAAAIGNNIWQDYIAQANMQGAQYTTWFLNGFTGNNDKRFLSFLSSLPRHPDALDFINSLYLGGTFNGLNVGTSMANFNYPPSWPK